MSQKWRVYRRSQWRGDGSRLEATIRRGLHACRSDLQQSARSVVVMLGELGMGFSPWELSIRVGAGSWTSPLVCEKSEGESCLIKSACACSHRLWCSPEAVESLKPPWGPPTSHFCWEAGD